MAKGGRKGMPTTDARRPDADLMLRRYWRNLRGSVRPEGYYRAARHWFVAGRPALSAGEDPTAEDVGEYVSGLRRSGLADTTIDWRLRAIGAMYRVSHLRLPRPPLPLDTQNESVALSPELVVHLIGQASGGRYTPTQRALLAVATLYGARVSEMAAMTTRDVDLPHRRLRIPTAKGGLVRWQRIPDAAAWALSAPWRARSAVTTGAEFKRICHLADVPQPAGVGWHAIRHALAIGLQAAGLPVEQRSAFMRWKTTAAGAEPMADRYPRVTTVATASGMRRVVPDDPDTAVWAGHPFLGAWVR